MEIPLTWILLNMKDLATYLANLAIATDLMFLSGGFW